MLSNANSFTRQGPSGGSYCVAIKISDSTFKGSIHDNDTFRFELLEEDLAF